MLNSGESPDAQAAVGQRRARRTGIFRSIRPFLPGKRRLAELAALSFLAGLAQAAMLVLLVHVAVSSTADDADADLAIGPLDLSGLSVTSALVAAVALALIALVLQFASAMLMARTSAQTLSAERKRLFRAFMRAPWPVKARQRDGRLQELLTNHAAKGANGVVWVASALDAAFNLIALVAAAVLVEALATAGALVLVAGLFLAVRPLAALGRAYASQQAADGVILATAVTEAAGMALEATVFDVGDRLTDRTEKQIDDVSESFGRMKFVGKMVPDLYRSAAFVLILLGLGVAYAVDAGNIASLGAVVLLLLRSLGYTQILQRSSVHLLQLVPYLDQLADEHRTLVEDRDARRSRTLPGVRSLAFNHVGFVYEDGTEALRDVSFDVSAGEVIGVVGPSGSGKSTLFQVLMLLREPSSGQYLVNGDDTRSLDRSTWFDHIALVPQDSRLFKGTVSDNIAFFRDVPHERVKEAAQRAHIHDDIMAWPAAYGTDVGERGGQLSGGQRQRLYLARALVGQPSVLFLDEPTSALDVISEAHIQRSLEELRGQLTIFIIAHRLSTISMCDRIMVFEHGKLVEFGDHAALERTESFYKKAVNLSSDSTETYHS